MSIQLFESLDRAHCDVKIYVHEHLQDQFEPRTHYADEVIYGRFGVYRRQHLWHHLRQTIKHGKQADVIVGVCEGRASALALLAGFVLRKKVVLWLHADWRRFSKILSWRVRLSLRAFRYASKIVACSQGVAQAHAAFFPSNADRLKVIPNCIDFKAVTQAAKADLPDGFERLFNGPTIVAVGRLNDQKGFDLLIHAHKQARDLGADANLIILGVGDQLSALADLAKRLGVAATVHFAGFQENPYAFMSRATIFVSSSRFEGFGLVIAEALACKAPVIAFDCPSGPDEILEHGRYGVLVAPQDVGALGQEIASLLADPARRKAFSTHGPSRAANFDIEEFQRGWSEILHAAPSPKLE